MEVDVDQNKITGDEAAFLGVHRRSYVGTSTLPPEAASFSMDTSDLQIDTKNYLESDAVDRMVMHQALATALEQRQYEQLISDCEEYLAEVIAAEHALEGQHPKFSDVMDEWTETELERYESQGKEIDALDVAAVYEQLKEEIEADYADAIEAHDEQSLQAQAEWDEVRRMLNNRIDEQVLIWVQSVARQSVDQDAYAKAA